MKNKSVLITGATGFVGSNLLPYLGTNFQFNITAVSRNSDSIHLHRFSENVIIYDELFDHKQLRYTHYIHLAGKAHDLKNISDASKYYKVNYQLTKKLFDRFLKDPNSQTFIFISSVKAVADVVDDKLTEKYEPEPTTFYGKSKFKAEQYILENLPLDKRVIILRPCMIHGPGNKGNLNLLYWIISSGIPWPLGAYDNLRSFLSIDNFCFVIKEVLNGKLESGTYNIADDKALSTSELVSLISKLNNKTSRIWNVPKVFIKSVAKIGNFIPFPLNEHRLEKLTQSYIVSNKKIKKALGLKKMPVSAKEGMVKTLLSFQDS